MLHLRLEEFGHSAQLRFTGLYSWIYGRGPSDREISNIGSAVPTQSPDVLRANLKIQKLISMTTRCVKMGVSRPGQICTLVRVVAHAVYPSLATVTQSPVIVNDKLGKLKRAT